MDHAARISNERVSIIIPAFNEEKTIFGVIKVAAMHPCVAEVIVVDDGSRDRTADEARKTKAQVISLSHNAGKAAAMARGAVAAKGEILFFIDADIIGLTHELMDRLISEVSDGHYDMFVAIVGRKKLANNLTYLLPLLGGVRTLTREVWDAVPEQYRHGFQIEVALNYFAKKNHKKIGSVVVPGLSHVMKERKRGFWWGMYQRIFMILDISMIILKLYILNIPRIIFFKPVLLLKKQVFFGVVNTIDKIRKMR